MTIGLPALLEAKAQDLLEAIILRRHRHLLLHRTVQYKVQQLGKHLIRLPLGKHIVTIVHTVIMTMAAVNQKASQMVVTQEIFRQIESQGLCTDKST